MNDKKEVFFSQFLLNSLLHLVFPLSIIIIFFSIFASRSWRPYSHYPTGYIIFNQGAQRVHHDSRKRHFHQERTVKGCSMIVFEVLSTGYWAVPKTFAPINPSRSLALYLAVCLLRATNPSGPMLAVCLQRVANPFGPMLFHQFHAFRINRPYSPFYHNYKRGWPIRSAADGNSINSSPSDDNGTRTRLARALQVFREKIEMRIRDLRKNLSVKLLFFLVGFYSATAFATVIGQTGDWDILSAALAVAVVEGIGALMYKDSLPLIGKLKSLIIMFNYWKAGLSLGLFLDSFKY